MQSGFWDDLPAVGLSNFSTFELLLSKALFIHICASHATVARWGIKSSQMSHVGPRNLETVVRCTKQVCILQVSYQCWENYQNKAGLSNTVDYIYRRLLLQTYLGVRHLDLHFLPTGVGSFWGLSVVVFFKQQHASNLSSKPFQCSKISQFTAGALCCLCTMSQILVVVPPLDRLYFPLQRRRTFPFSLFVLRLLCFHSCVRWIFHCKSTSVLDPAPLNSFNMSRSVR